MPKKHHSKFVVSADPYPAVDTSKSNMIYQPPDAEQQNNKQAEYDGDQEWQVFLDSIMKSDDPDLKLNTPGLSYQNDQNQVEFDYPDFFEYETPFNSEYDYENGIRPEIQAEIISIDKLFDRSDNCNYTEEKDDYHDTKDDEESIPEPPYSELLEDDWDIGMIVS